MLMHGPSRQLKTGTRTMGMADCFLDGVVNLTGIRSRRERLLLFKD